MLFSRDRILTTHVGSLPRNEKLSDLLMAQEEGKPYDPKVMAAEMDAAVRHVVKKQMEAGIDIGNDGEQRRISFQTYVPQRMTGFGGVSKRRRGIEFEEFPELLSYLMRRFPNAAKSQQGAPEARAELKYKDMKPITEETQGFKRIADELGAFSERFMTAPSPGIISTTMLNAYYESHDDYLDAIAREMKNEYQTIHKAGLILQIDAPDLAMDRTMMYRDLDDAGFVKRVERHVQLRARQLELRHAARLGAIELARVVEHRHVSALAHVRHDGTHRALDCVVLRRLVAREPLERGIEPCVRGRHAPQLHGRTALAKASMSGCSAARRVLSAAWLTIRREETGMISSTATSWLALSVLPVDTRSTIASASPRIGASSIDP